MADYGLEVYDANGNLRVDVNSAPLSTGGVYETVSVPFGTSTPPYPQPGVSGVDVINILSFGYFDNGGDGIYGSIDAVGDAEAGTVTFTNNGYTDPQGNGPFEYDWTGLLMIYREGV